MKTIQNSLTAAVIATAMTLPMAGVALADDASALATKDAVMLAANDTMNEAGDAASDTWITTKVKSSLLAEDATPGMDIKVETSQGVVSLSGTVATEAEREAAIAKAKSIEGVRDVSADGLKAVD